MLLCPAGFIPRSSTQDYVTFHVKDESRAS